MSIKKLLKEMVERNASDLFYRAGGSPRLRIDGKLVAVNDRVLSIDDVIRAAEEITTIKQMEFFKNNFDVDFAVYVEELDLRFRVSMFIVVRKVSNVTQTFEQLNLPADVLRKLATAKGGLVLLTGSMGSGKSTTIASMIDYINNNRQEAYPDY